MGNLPNFTASLLHKAYGLDISGEVVDGGQQNMKDLRYQNTPPNPQQYTQAPDGQTLEPGASLYHGTTMNLWKTKTPAKLSLTTDRKTAEIEAQNAVESASYHDGHPEQPIVVIIKFGDHLHQERYALLKFAWDSFD